MFAQGLYGATSFHSLLGLLAVGLDPLEFVNQDSLLLHIGLVDLGVLLVLHLPEHCITHTIALLLVLSPRVSRIESQRFRHVQVS